MWKNVFHYKPLEQRMEKINPFMCNIYTEASGTNKPFVSSLNSWKLKLETEMEPVNYIQSAPDFTLHEECERCIVAKMH
jgi:hypothetical protein